MKNKLIFFMLGIVIFGLSLGAGYLWSKNAAPDNKFQSFVVPSVPKKQVDDFARNFAKLEPAKQAGFLPDPPFLDLSGNQVSIKDFYGKPTLVNIWARWCAPCVVELPSLEAFKKRYEGRINVVAIAMEEGKEPKEISSFLKSHNIGDFAGYVDKDGGFGRALGVRGLPTSFLLGKNGQILYRFEGDAEWDSIDSTEFFDVFLLQQPLS